MHDLVVKAGSVVDGTGAAAYEADIAVTDGVITDIGGNLGPAKREIDAKGKIVTPGFVDAHTHYDGQVTWDEELSPSTWHGVTTNVMGNCGVGFAPVRPDGHEFLIQVMEGVEEIPGVALAEGMSWNWESFPEYLDVLDALPRSVDVVAQVPHSALRCYVMGQDRAFDGDATPADVAEMKRLTKEALEAGALGFSTSRSVLHRVKMKGSPPVPGTYCRPEELKGIAEALGEVGYGVFQFFSDMMGDAPDLVWMKEIARDTERPIVFTLAQTYQQPEMYKEVMANLTKAYAEEHLDMRAAVPWRPPGVLQGLQAALNPFLTHPSFKPLTHAPLGERLKAMRDPGFRARVLSEEMTTPEPPLRMMLGKWDAMYPLGDPPEYEPKPEGSIAARAAARGVSPAEFAYDTLLEDEGRRFIYFPLANYAYGDFEALREMMTHERATASLSDGGAHVGTICDASFTTYMLTHWVRDRSRGPRLPLEQVIQRQTSETARLYGLEDRGTLARGLKADINVIDFDNLSLRPPYMAFDLPAGGRRLLQKADGFDYTIVAGDVVVESDEVTNARPGKLVRGPQGVG